uniref:Uncharacterized protein n=1 Tax=Ascaris lumbricoides TaxID=6252 RepID=A0A9J2PPZ0_ASCLU
MVCYRSFLVLCGLTVIVAPATVGEGNGSNPHTHVQEQYQEEKQRASRTVTSIVSTARNKCNGSIHRSCKRQSSMLDEGVLCEIKEQRAVHDTFCYYWMEIGHYPEAFFSAGWNGEPKNPYIRGNIEEICSRLPDFGPDSSITGITYVPVFQTTNYTPFTDCIYFCCKECDRIGRYSLLPFMRRVYLHHEISKSSIRFAKESLAEHGNKYKMRCHDFTNRRVSDVGSRACVSMIVADEKFGIQKYTGPMIMSYLTQIDPANFHKYQTYSPDYTPQSIIEFPGTRRLCFITHPDAPNATPPKTGTFIPDMSCLIEVTAKSYRRICCCNPSLQECPTSLYANGIACATGQTAECMGEAAYLRTFVPEFFIGMTGETGPLCAVYHDLGKRRLVNLLLYDNMVLSDPDDKRLYWHSSSCNIIEVMILPKALSACADNFYAPEEILLGRPVIMCTCDIPMGDIPDWSRSCDQRVDRATVRLQNMLSTLKNDPARDNPTHSSPTIRPLPPCYHTKAPLTIKARKFSKDEYHKSIKKKKLYLTVSGHGVTLLSGEVSASGSKMRTICATFVKKVKEVHCDLFDGMHVCCCKNKRESKEPCNGGDNFANYINRVLYELFEAPAKKINDTTSLLT